MKRRLRSPASLGLVAYADIDGVWPQAAAWLYSAMMADEMEFEYVTRQWQFDCIWYDIAREEVDDVELKRGGVDRP